MEKQEAAKNASSEDAIQLNRNRSFKSKLLVRSQAIRESQSPPRTVSPSVVVDDVDVTPDVDVAPEVSVTPDINVKTDAEPTHAQSNDISSQNDRCSDVHSLSECVDECRKNQQVEIQVVESSEAPTGEVPPSCLFLPRSSSVALLCVGLEDKRARAITGTGVIPTQITSGSWDEPQSEQRQRTKRWLGYRQHSRDLLSNNPRVACVCGACTACPHCRGRRRRHVCPTKQDSGIVCSDDCPDCSDSEPNGGTNAEGSRKSSSLDVDDQTLICRCPEKKEKLKSISLSRTDSDDKTEPTGLELVNFIKETLNKNARDRMTLLKIEKELHALVSDPGRFQVRFPVMTSYGRMLVHRCASLFQLCHHLDQTNKTCVLVSKNGTSGGRLPCTSFKQWCTAHFPQSPRRQPDFIHATKSILKRDTHSLDEPGSGALSASRSKSLEQREREYERVRRRIFSTDNCSQDESQWQWLNSGPVKLLTPEGGRNKLLKVQSLEGNPSTSSSNQVSRGAVSKSHSFGGYGRQPDPPRLLSRQGDLASSSWRLSPSSSGYRTLSLHSTDSVTPSPTGGASPEPGLGPEGVAVVWAVTDLSAVPPGALVIHPQTGRPLTNPDGSVYHFDPNNPPVLSDHHVYISEHKIDSEKKRGRLEKQHSFMDNECECRPSEELRSKCCECRRHDTCHRTNSEKITTQPDQKVNQKPPSPCKNRYQRPPEAPANANTPTEPPTNHRPTYDTATNQKPAAEIATNQRPANEATNQSYNPSPNPRPGFEVNHRPYEPSNQRQEKFENQRPPSFETNQKYEPTNQRPPSETAIQKPAKMTNQGPEVNYVAQQYPQQYTHEEVSSPHQPPPTYVQHEMGGPAMAQIKHMQMADPNMRAMPLGMVYQPPYPFSPLPMYQPMLPANEDHKHANVSPHNENTFRIDPSYPYAAVDYTSCTGCEPRQVTNVGAVPGVGSIPAVGNVMPIEQLQCSPYSVPHHHYPYQEGMQWQGVTPVMQPKLYVPELYPLVQYNVPTVYPQYNLMYPQVISQPYPVCQPVYQPTEQRRGSLVGSHRHSKRNSISGSSRNTPLQTPPDDKKVPYEETSQPPRPLPAPHANPSNPHTLGVNPPNPPNDIALKIQQIKDQMSNLNTRGERRGGREDWKRRNSGNGILGSHPLGQFNGRVVGPNDETQLSSAARAIVNSIRNMQAKNAYQQDRREFNPNPQYRDKDREWRRRDDKERETDRRPPPVQYRHDYFLRQMSPGTWCRRSPAPIHPVLNPPRRPHPDNRHPRR